MTRILAALATFTALTAGANAADLPRRVAPPQSFTPLPVFTWTGFYGGLESTYVFTDRQRVRTLGISDVNARNVATGARPAATAISEDGFANIGGTVGYNYQFTPGSGIVVGVANSVDWTDLNRRRYYLGV